MRSTLLMSVALVAVSGVACAQSKQDFELVNRTGYTISEVYVSTSKTNDWEEDILGEDTLDDGDKQTIHFKNVGKACMWDLKVVYQVDHSSAVWKDIDLCKTSRVTIKYNKKSDTSSAVFD